MKKNLLYTLLIILSVCMGCKSYKDVPYIKDSDDLSSMDQFQKMYDARIMPKDVLTITVNCPTPEVAAPFNLTVQSTVGIASSSLTSGQTLQSYLVNNNGDIDFPIMGKLHLGGMTKNEAENYIKRKLMNGYIKEEPIITVKMANYKISVIGEVNRPSTFTVSSEKINVFEALAQAGDMTIYGKRDNVKLIREDASGKIQVIKLNLNNSDVLLSPYYYLQQNDILYIEPNKTKAKNAGIGTSTTIWFTVIGFIISIATFIVTLTK